MSQYNYVVTANESGSIKRVLKVDLFGDGRNRLLAIKTKSIEVYDIKEDEILIGDNLSNDQILDLPVLSRVGSFETYKDVFEVDRWHPKGQNFDDILILTKEYELALLRAHILESGTETVLYFRVMESISLHRENLRKSQLVRMMIHPEKLRIIVLAYEGCLQVVNCEILGKESRTKFLFPIILRLSELVITDICLVHTTNERSLLGILYDSGYSEDPRLMKMIELPLDLRKWTYNTNIGFVVPQKVMKIVPFYYRSKNQKMIRGFFLLGDGIVEYKTVEEIMPNKAKSSDAFSTSQKVVKTRFNSGVFSGMDIGLSSSSIMDVINLDDGSRWLVLDSLGRLFIMVVEFDLDDSDRVVGVRLDMLNRFSPFSRITHIGRDLFFLASKLSDSLLLYAQNNKLFALESIPNIGPIRDMLFSDVNRGSGNKTAESPLPLTVACGFGSGGALKSISNGIGLQNIYTCGDPFVGEITKIFRLRSRPDLVVITGIQRTFCYKLIWNFEKCSEKNTVPDSGSEGFDKENPGKKNENSLSVEARKSYLNLEKTELPGLKLNEETIRICEFGEDYSFQVTSTGLSFLGGKGIAKHWQLKDSLALFELDHEDYIEKFDFCPKREIIALSTSNGLLLVYRFDRENSLVPLCHRTKEELFELTSSESSLEAEPVESRDLCKERKVLCDSIPKTLDEVCILGVFTVDNSILLFLGTWMDGSKLSCLLIEDARKSEANPTIELLFNIETDFREYETMITALRVFELERRVETRPKENATKSYIVLLMGTNNGYLQLQYLSNEEMRSIIKKRSSPGFKESPKFEHYNTWKVSNGYISDINELKIPDSPNRHFFICCEQPKVLYWSYASGKRRRGVGVWSFYNMHSPWISQMCQISKPSSYFNGADRKNESTNKTCVIFLSHEEQEQEKTQIYDLERQNSKGSKETDISSKMSQRCFLKIGLVDTFQRYNNRSIPLGFTPEKVCFIDHLNMYAVVGVKERYENKSEILKPTNIYRELREPQRKDDHKSELIFVQSMLCLVSPVDLKVHYFQVLGENIYPTCVEYVTLQAVNELNELRSFLVVGTNKIDPKNGQNSNLSSERENYGKITLYSIVNKTNSFELIESAIYETEVAPFVVKEFKQSQLLISIENSLVCLELHLSQKPAGSSASSSSSSSADIWIDMEPSFGLGGVELKKKEVYSTHTMIVFIRVWKNEYILVGDLMRSVGIWEFDKYTGKFYEVCRDNSVAWVIEGIFLSQNMYLISDENKNLRVLMRALEPENDEANTSLSCIAHIHIGESVTCFQSGKFTQAYPEMRKNTGGQDIMEESPGRLMFSEQIAFGTSEGSVYLIFSVKDDPTVFSQLVLIEEAIIKALKNNISEIETDEKVKKINKSSLSRLFIKSSDSLFFNGIVGVLGGKNSSPFRWELNSTKESYNFEYECSGSPRGFVCGDVVESFLDFSAGLQSSVLSELSSFKYARKLKMPGTVQELETLIEQLRNMH
ncbi:CPSF A subunit domain-containing protein [Cryptosporidium felis]|nr:CPSF A subunit domain-containing protein [Cryptosporidium felis]